MSRAFAALLLIASCAWTQSEVPSPTAVMHISGMRFEPHVLVVPAGTTVTFKNDDRTSHNVFWPSVGGNKKGAHNLGVFPGGQERAYQFTEPGVVPLLCVLIPEMSAYIVVTPEGFDVARDGAGNYKIDFRTLTASLVPKPGPVPTSAEQPKKKVEAQAAPPPPTLALSLQPANVQVYVDDIFKGMTSSEGRLVVEGLVPGAHRVRMNLLGYTESARTVELKAGETATIETKLEPAGPKPLALAEIEEALTNGLPPKGITKLVNQYGVDFALTKEVEQRLRDKGADSDLLVAIATNKK